MQFLPSVINRILLLATGRNGGYVKKGHNALMRFVCLKMEIRDKLFCNLEVLCGFYKTICRLFSKNR